MDLGERELTADAVASPAMVATRDTYEDAVDEFESRHYTYMPLPEDGEYYVVGEGWFGELRADQWVAPDLHLSEVLERLCDNPFLLVDYSTGEGNESEVGTEGDPEASADPGSTGEAERDSDYGIVNVSDVNKRPTHEMLYPVVAEFATLVASRIESRYESRELFDRLDDHTVGAWVKDERRNVELHIAESMDLGEMQRVLQSSPPALAKSCGFDSKDELDDLDAIRDLRNRVMHANRSLVREREDIREMLDTVERARELIAKANSGAAFR